MKELIDTLANNDYVIYSLAGLLGILVILFFILLFSGKNKKTKKEEKIVENIEEKIVPDAIDFDHNEYVKETTAEFELTPIADVKPTPDEFVPDVKFEESPAIDINAKNVEDVPLADFNFDELSKSISAELDKLRDDELKAKEANKSYEVPTAEAFSAAENGIKPIELARYEDLKLDEVEQTSDVKYEEPTFITDFNAIPDTKPIETQVQESKDSTPVINDVETPLFARFNQETYDINAKD